MAVRYVSEEAREMSQLRRGIKNLVHENTMYMRRPTLNAVVEILLEGIEEIQKVMLLPQVRGNLDPNLQKPNVDEDSSFKLISRRLANQIKTVCILADLVHSGPEANNDEKNALVQVKQILRTTFDKISSTISPDLQAALEAIEAENELVSILAMPVDFREI